jgi:hypothetical protein
MLSPVSLVIRSLIVQEKQMPALQSLVFLLHFLYIFGIKLTNSRSALSPASLVIHSLIVQKKQMPALQSLVFLLHLLYHFCSFCFNAKNRDSKKNKERFSGISKQNGYYMKIKNSQNQIFH